ncbi:MAG TPA: LPS assembly protein LptD [Thermoanaerobaculia bacterium]|jgi:LPS-assembly protein
MTASTLRALSTLLLATLITLSAAGQQRPKFRFAAGPKPGGGEVKVTVAPGGRTESQRDEYVISSGGVTVEYQDIKIVAEKITLNNRTRDVVAEGNVIIDQGPSRVTATQAIYNIDLKTGTFFNATATMDPQMYFAGDRIEKVDEDTFRLTNGVFTSCDLDRPPWSFHVGSAEVTLDDYAHLRDVSFRAKGIPVFWTPILTWPTKRDRSKGLLIPRVLYSDRFGSRLELGYYMPFGDSVDATVYGELNTRQYFGAGVNVRYLPSENIKIGEFTAYTVRNPEPELSDPTAFNVESQQEWRYEFRHAQENLPGGFRGVVDVQDYSNLDFFREFDRDGNLNTASNIYSSAYLTKNKPTYSLNVIADRRDLVFLTQRQRYEQLPSLQVRMYPQRVGSTPLYFSMESSASHLRTSSVSPLGIVDRSADYNRGDIFPTLSLQLRTPSWLSIKPQVSVRETWYSASLDPATQRPSNDESLTRSYAQAKVEMVGPSFSRVFNRSIGSFSRFKHVIEPRFDYIYTTNVRDQARIIGFDSVDTPYLPIVQNSLQYELTQRILGKESGPNGQSREILSFSLSQTAALSEPFTRTTITGTPIPVGETHTFTPLTASLHVNPFQTITLDASAIFGNVSHQLDQTSVSANVIGSGQNADKYLSFTWFAAFRDPRIPEDQPGGERSQVRVRTGSNVWHDRLRGDLELNFDAQTGKFLEQRVALGGTGSCYGIALEYRRYLVYGLDQFRPTPSLNPRTITSYGISITLKNVGTIATH